MAIPKGLKENLKMIVKAARNGDLVLLDCQDKATSKPVVILAAVSHENDGSSTFVPFAKMLDGNPYDGLNPPNPEGGYFKETE